MVVESKGYWRWPPHYFQGPTISNRYTTLRDATCPDCQADAWCGNRWRYIPSLSRKATSGDNARTEGFFGTMKQELLKGRPVVSTMTVEQMRDYIDTYIDFYIHRRLKSTLGDGYTTIAEHRQALSA